MHKVCVCGLDTSKLPKISNNEAYELMLKIKKDNDPVAKEKFIMANLRLVLSLCSDLTQNITAMICFKLE